MISKNTYHKFWKVAGEDYQIVSKANNNIQNRFLISGMLIVFIFFVCFISFFFSFKLIFNQTIFAVIISLFVTLMFYNIYKINLITLSPIKLTYCFPYLVSLFVRMIFLMIIGIVISKPLEAVLFKFFLADQNMPFISSIKTLNGEYPAIWLFTFFIIVLVAIPFFLKFTINPANQYSRSIIVLNKKLVENDYLIFKNNYSKIFEKSIGGKLEVIENYEDPPFNTIKKKDKRKIGTEKEFLNHLYGI
jgi:hypothetical protein